jgi:hypothetical protein
MQEFGRLQRSLVVGNCNFEESNMRNILLAGAALAAVGLSAPTFAQTVYEAGGPKRVGNMCQVITDDQGNGSFGYMAPCPDQPGPAVVRAKKRPH